MSPKKEKLIIILLLIIGLLLFAYFFNKYTYKQYGGVVTAVQKSVDSKCSKAIASYCTRTHKCRRTRKTDNDQSYEECMDERDICFQECINNANPNCQNDPNVSKYCGPCKGSIFC